MALISISGRKNSGKNTVGEIIEYLSQGLYDITSFEDYLDLNLPRNYEQKQWAGKVKQMVALLLGVSVEQLEDREYKEASLGDQWALYFGEYSIDTQNIISRNNTTAYFTTKQRVLKDLAFWADEADLNINDEEFSYSIVEEIVTPRKLMQTLGTDWGRNMIHPDLWVMSTMADYISYSARGSSCEFEESRWIFTDTRFPNELQAVKDRGGLTIEVRRPPVKSDLVYREDGTIDLPHISETALDDAEFDYTIINDGSIADLVEKVRDILIKEKLINENV